MAYTKQVATHSTDDTITAAHLNTEFDYIYGTVLDEGIGTTELTDAGVTTAKLGADAVDGTKIADDAIDSEHYTDGSIDTAHIGDAQVSTAKIANDAITNTKLNIYDSGWGDVHSAKGTHKKYTHNLNAVPFFIQVWLSSQSDGVCTTTAHWTSIVGGAPGGGYDNDRGTWVTWTNATDLYVWIDATYSLRIKNRAGTSINTANPIYMRVVAFA